MITKKTKKEKLENLYWCSTRFGDRDWFVHAPTEDQAKNRYFSLTEYPSDVVKVRRIRPSPNTIDLEPYEDVVELELLEDLEFDILQRDDPAIVRYNGKLFVEGNGDNLLFADSRHRVPSLYLMHMMGTDRYKIGYSRNVHARRKHLNAGTPYYTTILGVIKTPLAKTIEREILFHFKRFKCKGEWLALNDWAASLLKTTFNLYHNEYFKCSKDHICSSDFEDKMRVLKTYIDKYRYLQTPDTSDLVQLAELSKTIPDSIKGIEELKYINSF